MGKTTKNERLNLFEVTQLPRFDHEFFLDQYQYEVLAKTDWQYISNWLSQKVKSNYSEIISIFDENEIKNFDPHTIANLCNYLVVKHFKYDDVLYNYEIGATSIAHFDSEQIKEMNMINQLPLEKLLQRGKGLCRHMTLLLQGFYAVFKKWDKEKKLVNSELYAISALKPTLIDNTIYADVNEHTFLLLVHQNQRKISFTILDPTFSEGSHLAEKAFGFTKLPQFINFLSSSHFFNCFGKKYYSYKDLLLMVEQQLKALEIGNVSLDMNLSKANLLTVNITDDLKGQNLTLNTKYNLQDLVFSAQYTSSKVGIITGLYQLREKLRKKEFEMSLGSKLKGADLGFEYLWQKAKDENSQFRVAVGILIYLDAIRQPKWLLKVWTVLKDKLRTIQNNKTRELVNEKFRAIYNDLFSAATQKTNVNFKLFMSEHRIFLRDYEKVVR